ncbi:RagB/SusD family nutrient uptake outer membrane protein [Dyadobacter sp. 32]|uniref:RagB/SusD family nutrient uptake outer membrane protein n=1 Tax=Dyadobacter sp. 32 TaxID=538966 RepID=UPI0011ECDC56
MKNLKYFYLAGIALFLGACNVIDQEPIDAVSNEQLFTKGTDAQAAIIGAYKGVLDNGFNYMVMAELPTKNVKGNALNRQFEQLNNLQFLDDNGYFNQLWTQNYLIINRVNVILQRVPQIEDPSFSATQKAQILAEAYMIRAHAYFNLIRYFSNVPLIINPTASPDLPSLQISRDNVAQVYEQVFKDLEIARRDLPVSYSTTLQTKGRVTRAAAHALAVRIHLFRKEYDKTIAAADEILAQKSTLNNTYAALFEGKNADESIWELQYDNLNPNSIAGTYLPAALGGTRMIEVNPDILAAYETGDLRRAATIGVSGTISYVKKYTRRVSGDDNFIIFRLAEVILSKAEALAETSYPNATALSLLNQIRTRAGLAPLTTAEVPSLASFRERLYKERRLELSYEGHAWFDLVRTDRIDSELGITNPNFKLWPVPAVEILRNPNLLPQNPGYE